MQPGSHQRSASSTATQESFGTRFVWMVVACVLASVMPAAAEMPNPALDPKNSETPPPELVGIQIEDKAGATVPGDISLRDQDGKPVKLAEYFDGKRPTILVM